jgi:hypothetical protein
MGRKKSAVLMKPFSIRIYNSTVVRLEEYCRKHPVFKGDIIDTAIIELLSNYIQRENETDDIKVDVSTRIKLETFNNLTTFCRENGVQRERLVDQAVNEYLDRLEE